MGWYNASNVSEGQAMSTSSVAISESSRVLLQELAEKTGQTPLQMLDHALSAYRRQLFFDQLNAGYTELRSDPAAWAEHQAEQKLWETTLMDGLASDN
ncbi:MAG: toxin-antitoxin system protein [Planctomycetia bacterium]|nr:toxin-antitoxin system protein [Planctomycetia bacterium]